MRKCAELENCAMIRVWYSSINNMESGHVSLQTPKYYISYWPDSPIESKSEATKSHKGILRTHQEDIVLEKREADLELCLYTLNTTAIDEFFEKIIIPSNKHWTLTGDTFKFITASYGKFTHSCSSLIYHALKIGDIESIIPGAKKWHFKSAKRAMGNGILMLAATLLSGALSGAKATEANSHKYQIGSTLKFIGDYTGFFFKSRPKINRSSG